MPRLGDAVASVLSGVAMGLAQDPFSVGEYAELRGPVRVLGECAGLRGPVMVSVLFEVVMGLALDPFLVGECAGPRGPVRVQCASMGGLQGTTQVRTHVIWLRVGGGVATGAE